MTHIFRSILAVSLLTLCTDGALANLFLYDSFDYGPSGTSLGTAGSANWVKNGTSPDPTVQSGGGLTYPGLQVSTDNVSLQYDGSGVNAGSGAPAGTDGHTLSATGINTGSLYYSMLMKVTAVQVGTGNGFGTGANLSGGSFMAGLQNVAATGAPATNTSAATLLIRSGDQVNQFATTYQLGTSITTTTADRTWYTGQSFTTGASAETVFVVVKYTIDPVNGDTASLFINPTPGGAEPAAQVTAPFDANFVLGTGFKSFFVRNNSVEPDGMLIDELRIGDTWQDVTPAAGAGTAGDYNNDGKVDAADYATWRKYNNTTHALPNDNGLGTPITASHYDLWRANFGKPAGAGSGVSGATGVPEPTAIGLAVVGLAICGLSRRKC
jgi:hypothetical protein